MGAEETRSIAGTCAEFADILLVYGFNSALSRLAMRRVNS